MISKPRPIGIDTWSHFLHDADGNPVANDTVVDAPHHLQWTGGPRYARTHEGVSSVNVVVSDEHRLYCIADTSPVALPDQLATQWALIARDAFNGVVLWQKPLKRWQARSAGSRHLYPPDLFRRLVASKRYVFTTLDILGPVVALDPATGRTIRAFDRTKGDEEILYAAGTLYVVVNPKPADAIDRRSLASQWPLTEAKRLMAFDADSGRLLWEKNDNETVGLAPMATAVRNGRLVLQNPRAIICLNAATGKTVWRTERRSPTMRPVYGTPTLVLTDDVVLSADRGDASERRSQKTDGTKQRSELIAYDFKTGEPLWKTPCAEGSHVPNELFVVDGLDRREFQSSSTGLPLRTRLKDGRGAA